MSQQTGSNAIILSQPGAGQTVNVPIDADNMRLSLGFTPDPNAVAKNGQNLEFTFEDGGKIVLDGYYDHFSNKTLPVMVTESGDELPGEDFLASLNEDLLTAAGPGAGGSTGSGGSGEYADDAGALIAGVDRLGSLGTMYWGYGSEVPEEYRGLEIPSLSLGTGPGGDSVLSLSTYGLNESEAGFSLYLNLTFPAPGDITVQIRIGGSATMLENESAGEEFRCDYSVPDGSNYSYDPATGILTVTIPAGTTSVEVPVNLIDDHINDSAKDITFTVEGTSGPVYSAAGATATANISEDRDHGHTHSGDNEAYVYDGPIVSFDNAALVQKEDTGKFEFKLNFTDPHTGGEYEGFNGDGLLSQDMTLTFKISNDGLANGATYGDDYYVDTAALEAMPGVESAVYDPVTGTLTIKLTGRVDENGDAHDPAPSDVFSFANGPDLTIPIVIVDDAVTERADESFTIELVGATGNESFGEGSASGTIEADDRGRFNGPELSLVVGSLHESDTANDPYGAAAPGKTTHTINLSKASTEDIKVWVSITDGTAEAGVDYVLPATMDFKVTLADNSVVTVTGTLDSVTGKYQFTIPEGAVKVEFDVNAIDNNLEDRFAANNGVGEYEVSLGLVKTDANGVEEGQPGYDASTGLADGEATIDDGAGGTTDVTTGTAQITEDLRTDGADSLNPDYFDGPLVHFTGDTAVSESSGITQGGLKGVVTGDDADDFNYAVYNISLKNPNGDGTAYNADESVTVTFKLTLGSDISAADINVNGMTYWYTDANGDPQSGAITVTGMAPEYTFSVTVPAGSSEVSFQVPVVDDHVGGYDDGSKVSDADESYKIEITGIEGNEARLPDSDRDGNYDTNKEIATEIQDDNSAATLDGPVIGAVVNTTPNGTGGAFLEGTQNVEIQLTLTDPADGTDYNGYKNSGVLSEQMEITVTLEGLNAGSEYGVDYVLDTNQLVLDDLVTNGVIDGYTVDHGTGSITIQIPAGTNLQHLQDHLKITVDILNDTVTENGEGFKVKIDTMGNESQASSNELEIKIEDDGNGARIGIAGKNTVEGSATDLEFTLSCSNGAAPAGEVSITVKFGGTANATGGDPMDTANSESSSIDYKFQEWVDAMTAAGKLTGPDGDGNYTLTLQPGDWNSNGTYTFGFETVEDMYSEGNQTVTVEIVKVEGQNEEVVNSSNKTGTATITDDKAVNIVISDADQKIYEDADHAAAEGGKTVAVHTITFNKHANLDGHSDLTGLKAVEDFTFQVRVTQGAYDNNILNDGTASGAGDFRWAFQEALYDDGANPEYGVLNPVTADMLVEINQWMVDNGYLPADGSVSITGIAANGTITFQVKEGYPLDADSIKLPVQSVDNFTSQGEHDYQLQIVAGDGKNETVGGDYGKGTIIEETGDFLDGFRIGVEAQDINESEGAGAFIVINLYDEDGNKLDAAPATPDGNTKITLVFDANGIDDPATIFSDYRIDNAQLVDGKWQLVITVTPDQWVDLNGGSGTPEYGIKIPVFVADNDSTDGDRGFNVSIDKIEGNEATTLTGKESAEVTITDDTKVPDNSSGEQDYNGGYDRDGKDVLDGPKLVGFYDDGGVVYGQTGASSIYEPGASDPSTSGARTTITYTIAFDHVAHEPILIALDLSGGASFGDDFEVGNGLVAVTTGMTVADLKTALGITDECDNYLGKLEGITINSDGTITVDSSVYASGTAFVAKVEAGSGQAKFTVNVKPDHLEESESITWTIKDMEGNEVINDDTFASNESMIKDDGDGPMVGITGSDDRHVSSSDPNNAAEYTMNISNEGGENFTATIEIVHGNTTPGDFPNSLEVLLPNGQTVTATLTSSDGYSSKYELEIPAGVSGDAKISVPATQGTGTDGGFFYIGVTGTDGTYASNGDRLTGDAESSASGALQPGRIDSGSGTGGGSGGGGTGGGGTGGGGTGGGSSNTISITGGGAVYEGDTGESNTIVFQVTRTTDDDSDPCEVILKVKLGDGCELADGPGGSGDFYFEGATIIDSGDGYATIKVTIPAGQTTIDLNAKTIGDTVMEADESFTILVAGGTNVDIDVDNPGSTMGTGTIINDDFPTMSIDLTVVDTVNHGGVDGFWEGTQAKLHVDFPSLANADGSDALSHPITLTITYTPSSVDGAELGADYVPQVYTVTIPAGTSIKDLLDNGYDFSVHLPDDAMANGNVNFDVTVEASVMGQGGPQTATDTETVTILDDAGTDLQDGPKIVMTGSVEGGQTGTSGMDYVSENGGKIVVDFTTDTVPTQNVTITLLISGLDRVKVVMHDFGDGNGEVACVNVFDTATGTYKPVAVTFVDAPDNTQATVEVPLNAGDNKAGIVLEPLDDNVSNGNSVVKVEVIDIEGSEARIVDANGNVVNDPAGAATKPGYEATIVDDGTRFQGDGVDFAAAADGPTVSIALASGAATSIAENGTLDTTFKVTLSEAGSQETTVTLQISKAMLDRIDLYDEDGNAHSGGDTYMKIEIGGVDQYVKVDANGNFSVAVPSGTTSFDVPVNLQDDLKTQSDTSFTVKITGVSGSEATIGTASKAVSLGDDRDGPQVSLSADTSSVVEGDTGTTATVTYKLTLTQPTQVDAYQEGMTVTLTLGGGSAAFGTDYTWDTTGLATALGGYTYSINGNKLTLTLTQSQLDTLLSGADGKDFTFDIPVTVKGDDKVEGDETFGMTVATTGSESAVVGNATVNTTIEDDDHRPGEELGGLNGETAIFMWDGSDTNTTLKADVLYNDADIDEDNILINGGTGNDYRGDFSHNGSNVEFTFDPNSAIFDTLPEGGKVTGNMGFDYTVKDEHGNVATDSAHMDVEVHYTNSFDGSSYTNDLIVQGTGGNDIIKGGSGDDYIRGGLGDDMMWGNGGQNSFVWEVEDIFSGGLDQVMDFTMGDDKLLFDDALTFDGIFDLSSNKLTLDVTLSDGTTTQQVEVTFESSSSDYQNFVADYNSAGDEGAKQLLVEQLINSITGN